MRSSELGAKNWTRLRSGSTKTWQAPSTYGLGWITGLAFLLAERENRFVRFHAMQSTIVFGATLPLWFVGTVDSASAG